MSTDHDAFLQTVFDELARRGPYTSLNDLNSVLGQITRQYNAQPQSDFGGLSPEQMYALLHDDWSSPNAVVRLDATLTLDEVAHAPLLADARLLLEYVASEGPIKMTQAGNLPRAVVAALRPQLRMAAQRVTLLELEVRGPLNEADVPWLAPLRYVMMLAGLVTRRKGFCITKQGRALLRPDRAGDLYARLFRAVFRELDLRSLDSDHQAGLQATIGYTLFRLGTCARDWTPSETLAARAWLDSAKDTARAWGRLPDLEHRHFALDNQVLHPLAGFGLLEARILPGPESERWRETTEFRVTPLYDRFLRFDLPQAPAPGLRLVR